jgi:hypothetical protein
MKKLILHGVQIGIGDDAQDLLIFLKNHMTLDEFDTVFGYAQYKKKAYFQDKDHHHFKVEYEDDVCLISEIE